MDRNFLNIKASGRLFVLFFGLITGLIAPTAFGGPITLEATCSANISNDRVHVERWRDYLPAFVAESFPPDGRGDQTGQRKTVFAGDGSPVNQILNWLASP